MQHSTIEEGHVTLLNELINVPEVKDCSNIISLTGNEITNLLLNITKHARSSDSIDNLFEKTLVYLGESGIAERVLLFQFSEGINKAVLTHSWSSPYIEKQFNPIGIELNFNEIPIFKLFEKKHTFQIDDFSRFVSLPNYIFKNKYKAFFMRLKIKSFLVSTGSLEKIKVALFLQFSSRQVIWNNEIEKLIQSVVDQLAIAIDQVLERTNKESLERNIILIQEKALQEKESLLRDFASNVHDLPCTIFPRLKEALRNRDFELCENLVDDLYSDLRQLINEYVVPDSDLLSFGSHVYQFLNGFKKSFKGTVKINLVDEEINLSQKQSQELFKVIREWFCNIEKHSNATEVIFEIKKINHLYYILLISDNGIGFNIEDTKNLGYGILNIRRRLIDLNAKYEIKSKRGGGSKLQIQINIESK